MHQPAAVDLRRIAAVKINNDLERIADLALDIPKPATTHAAAGAE